MDWKMMIQCKDFNCKSEYRNEFITVYKDGYTVEDIEYQTNAQLRSFLRDFVREGFTLFHDAGEPHKFWLNEL